MLTHKPLTLSGVSVILSTRDNADARCIGIVHDAAEYDFGVRATFSEDGNEELCEKCIAYSKYVYRGLQN